jgi:hypothetical protein
MLHVDPVTPRSEGRAVLIERGRCCPPSRFGLRPMPQDDGEIQAAFLRDSASTSTPMMSLSFMIRYSTPSILTSVPVTGLDIDRDELAGLVAAAGTDCHDLALLRLFLGGVRDDDAAGRLCLGVNAANDHAVVKGAKFH